MTTKNPFLTLDQKLVGDVYTSSEVMDNLTMLTDDFGSRFGGTEGERQAAEFMKAKLEAYGLQNVHLEPIEYIGWRRGEVTFEIISPVQKVLDCITLPHSPPADIEGVIIDLNEGAPDDFDNNAEAIRGKIALATSEVTPKGSKRWVHRMEKSGRATIAGAIGFIFVNHYPGYGPATGGIGHLDGGALIPGISLSWEDGTYIQRLIKRHGEVKVRLTSTDEIAPMISWNVLGDLPGKMDEVVMMGCHYDGHDISQGAGDPASGAVAVLEAARVLAKYGEAFERTIRFALWGVEEIGLIGSTQHVAKHEAELDKLRFYLNMDGAGNILKKGIVLNEWPELEPILAQWSDEMALPFGVKQSVSAFSDHYPFLLAGVPTGSIGNFEKGRSGRGYGHTRYDTLDKIEIHSLREAAVLAARLSLRISQMADWPVFRRDAEAVKTAVDNPDNQETAAFFATLDEYYRQALARKGD